MFSLVAVSGDKGRPCSVVSHTEASKEAEWVWGFEPTKALEFGQGVTATPTIVLLSSITVGSLHHGDRGIEPLGKLTSGTWHALRVPGGLSGSILPWV